MKIYNFDGCSNMPMDARVRSFYLKALKRSDLQLPLSAGEYCLRASEIIDSARSNVAALIGASADEIIFTSSGTEANNLAIKGFMAANSPRVKKIVASFYEHNSVSIPIKTLAKKGISCYKPDAFGDRKSLEALFAGDPGPALFSFTLLNVESGRILPVAEISKTARVHNSYIHCDACAAGGKMNIDTSALGVDMLSVSFHKFGGPPGVGALYIKKGTRVFPEIEGGSEERGLRGGFYNIAAIAAAGMASKLAMEEIKFRNEKLKKLRERFYDVLSDKIKKIKWVSSFDSEPFFYCSFCLEGVNSETIMSKLNEAGVIISPYSWCLAAAKTPESIKYSGLEQSDIENFVRVCFNYMHEEKDIIALAKIIARCYNELVR